MKLISRKIDLNNLCFVLYQFHQWATIAPWFNQRHPSCDPKFEFWTSHLLSFSYHFIDMVFFIVLWIKEIRIKERGRGWPKFHYLTTYSTTLFKTSPFIFKSTWTPSSRYEPTCTAFVPKRNVSVTSEKNSHLEILFGWNYSKHSAAIATSKLLIHRHISLLKVPPVVHDGRYM